MDTAKLILLCIIGMSTMTVSGSSGPILLFPGVAGSQLDGKTNDFRLLRLGKDSRSPKCFTPTYKRIWFSLLRLPWCAGDLKLSYDESTNTYRNTSGIDIRVPGFGGTDTVEYSTRFLTFEKEYMKPFVSYFTKLKCNYYKRGASIRAAPYDWRLAADELDRTGYFNRVKGLIEEMYDVKKQKVSLVAHSMGGLVSHYFLTSYSGVNKAWKETYIRAWITLGTPWAGSVKALQILLATKKTAPPKCRLTSEAPLSLARLVFKNIDKCEWWSELVPFGSTFESSVWLLPKPSVWKDGIIVKTNYKKKTYSAKDYKKLFKRSGYKYGYSMFEGAQKIDSTKYPGVPTYCFYGKKNKKTPEILSYVYKKIGSWKKLLKLDPIKYKKPKISYGDGDGTVNLKSLQLCADQWKGQKHFESMDFDGVGHTSILKSKKVLKKIASIVGAKDC